MNAFWTALQFLTRLPCPRLPHGDTQLLGRSALFYPVVGALIGLFLYAGAWLSAVAQTEKTVIIAALLLTLWVILTGALHLDGLGDSADAWLGGGDDRQRCFKIMSDPRSGVAAVVSIVLVLLLKFTALETLLTQQQFWPILLAPIIARATALALLLSTPDARPQGMSAAISEYLPRRTAMAVVLGSGLFALLIAPVTAGISLLVVALITYLLRRLMLKRLGGTTGDTCGALIEIIEASVLLSWCLFI